MGVTAARKAARIVANTRRAIAIEVVGACQALEFQKPLETSAPLQAAYRLVRTRVAPWDKDRIMAPDLEAVAEMVRTGAVAEAAAAVCGPLE